MNLSLLIEIPRSLRSEGLGELDPVTVILLENQAMTTGKLLVEHYGQAWSASFARHGSTSLASFLISMGPDDLCDRLARPDELEKGPVEKTLLWDICRLVVKTLRDQPSSTGPKRTERGQFEPDDDETALAFNLGAGVPRVEATDEERKQFEAWMKGHHWSISPWDGTSYGDMFTRTHWAVWRDRAALERLRRPHDHDGALDGPKP